MDGSRSSDDKVFQAAGPDVETARVILACRITADICMHVQAWWRCALAECFLVYGHLPFVCTDIVISRNACGKDDVFIVV